MKTSAAIIVGAVVLGLSGCGGSDSSSAAAAPQTPVTPTTTLTASHSADPTPSAAPPNVGSSALRVGDTREGMSATMTLEEIKYPLPPAQYRAPQPGHSSSACDSASVFAPTPT